MSSVALYKALKSVDVAEDLAAAAAAEIQTPIPAGLIADLATRADLKDALKNFVTKDELRAEMAILRTEMAQQGNRIVIALGVIMAVITAIARFLPAVKP